MIRTILIDDEPRGLSALSSMLQAYCPELEIIAACSEVTDAKEKTKTLDPQLVFLDISLRDKTGFDLLAELDPVNFEIIFVTAHNQYTLRAFQYSATDYLLKPIDEDLLVKAVKRAVKRIEASASNNVSTLLYNLNRLHAQKEMKLCVPSLKGFDVIDIQDILYCEAGGVYTNIHFANRAQICSSKGLSEYEKLLTDSGFVRPHNSFLVNLLHIKQYIKGEGGSLILSNNKEIVVSRRRKESIIKSMKEIYKF
ncbi:LytR/AlgR family response regulator transcription factor [Niabella aurantiaca]|uniref:LytR/AlgR family response regulator transcription factor n=1 Tax=Niabella aurantiaca TaxID=379900 RepID=UPI0012FADDC5|nr:LytTR family DNA-binding domain-containing protein [Niabella aurantiaca]